MIQFGSKSNKHEGRMGHFILDQKEVKISLFDLSNTGGPIYIQTNVPLINLCGFLLGGGNIGGNKGTA